MRLSDELCSPSDDMADLDGPRDRTLTENLPAGTSGVIGAPLPRERFVQRYLDPASRLGEILFGLIMVLSVTLTARVTAEDGPAGMRQVLLAAVGCNLAWALIDAVMYVMSAVTERVGTEALIAAVQGADTDEAALAIVRSSIMTARGGLERTDAGDRLALAMRDYCRETPSQGVRITRDDLMGAVACFGLVVLSCLPVILIFLAASDPRTAVTASSVVLIGMLFGAGAMWGRHAGVGLWSAGASMVAIGLTLVCTAILLGG